MNERLQRQEIITSVNNLLDTRISVSLGEEEFRSRLSSYINDLVEKDFERLISLLYRIDVDETKLRYLLQQASGENTGDLIAELIIERQLQKLKTRTNSKSNDDIPDDEKW